MRMRKQSIYAILLFALALAGCGGGSSTSPSPTGNTVIVTFTDGTPVAVAEQIGTGSFAAASLQSGKLTLTLPSGTTRYAIAYVCPPVTFFGTLNAESVIEATLQDGTAYSVSCSAPPTTGHATGKVDASLIAGAASVRICGSGGCAGILALDGSSNILGVKMVRAQSVPGTVNGGNTIVFTPSDATTTQSLTVTNLPAGFVSPPAVGVDYFTANGTRILINNNSPGTYRALPAAATQPGDFYSYESNTNDTATHNQAIGITQNTTSGGGPATIALPAPWSFSGPAAAALPTFTFNYSGFTGLAATADQAGIGWATGATSFNSITVTATGSFQNGLTTITIPNLSSLSGFFAPAPTGTTINWVGDIFGGTAQEFNFFPLPPANGSISFVQNRGTYIEP